MILFRVTSSPIRDRIRIGVRFSIRGLSRNKCKLDVQLKKIGSLEDSVTGGGGGGGGGHCHWRLYQMHQNRPLKSTI